jgi:Fic family protein
MRSLNLKYMQNIRLTSSQAATIKKIGEYQGKQALFSRQTPEILDSLRRVAKIESTESSNRLEGVTAAPDRVKALVADSADPVDRPEQEIAGYRDALALVHESGSYMNLSTMTIRRIHKVMYQYLPVPGGEFKRNDNQIVEIMPDGKRRVRFTPVAAKDTEDAIDTLARNFDHATRLPNMEPLIVIPLAVFDFLCIHPFDDGNGRASRLLTLLLLYRQDCQVGRFISLERIVEQSKTTYYETLETSSQGWHDSEHDPHPWLNYFWGVLLRAYEEFESRVGEIRNTKISKSEQIRMAVERRAAPFSLADIQHECAHISRDMIKLVLRDLKAEGRILLVGKGRGARWINNPEAEMSSSESEVPKS